MIQQRKNLRLPDYNYSQAGVYFVTVCAFEKMDIFCRVTDGTMILNDVGAIVREEWLKTALLRDNIALDEFVVMPNHVHGIIIINHSKRGHTASNVSTNTFRSPSQTIGAIVRGFKSAATKHINIHRKTPSRYVW